MPAQVVIQDYSPLPDLSTLPKIGDRIAFKVSYSFLVMVCFTNFYLCKKIFSELAFVCTSKYDISHTLHTPFIHFIHQS